MASGIGSDLKAGAPSDASACAVLSSIVDALEQRVRELEEKPLPVPPGDALLEEGSYVSNVVTSCWHYIRSKPRWPAEYQPASFGWAFHYSRYSRAIYKHGGEGLGGSIFCKL